MSTINILLERLDGVRRFGNGWRANCPVGHSSRGALSIGERDDGAVMLHCFAGCPAADVVAAVGLSLADLFPERQRDNSPAGRRAARTAIQQASWAAALGVLAWESTVVEATAESILRGGPVAREDVERVHLASIRIHDAREMLA